jgi:hypothetical protein
MWGAARLPSFDRAGSPSRIGVKRRPLQSSGLQGLKPCFLGRLNVAVKTATHKDSEPGERR